MNKVNLSEKNQLYLIRGRLCRAWTFLQHRARGVPPHELAAAPPKTQFSFEWLLILKINLQTQLAVQRERGTKTLTQGTAQQISYRGR